MSVLHSYTELPPEGRSPALARRLVESALREAGQLAAADEALLLVTELVTNAVVHAGTTIGLDLRLEPSGLRVEVSDRGAGRVTVRDSPAENREGGRGMYLLDVLATEWGTRYRGGEKSVWFTLGARSVAEPVAPAATPDPARRDLAFLLALPADLEHRLGPERVVAELLRRLVEGLGCEHGWVFGPTGADPSWRLHARYDETPAPEPDAVRRGLPRAEEVIALLGPAGAPTGALVLGPGQLAGDDRALARLVADRIAVILRDESSRVAQLRQRNSLAVLAEASEMFAGTLDVQLTVSLAAQLVVPRSATWSAVWITYDHTPALQAVAHADEAELAGLRVALSGSLGQALAERLAADAVGDRPFLLPGHALPPPLSTRVAGDVLVLPLVARRRLLGLQIVGREAGVGLGGEENGLLVDLARLAALAIDNARLYAERSQVATALQASLLPPELPVAPGVQFGARYVPAGEGNEVGGDFYDVFTLPGGDFGIAVGDVCGKGASAAAITGMARDVLRLLTRDGATPPRALQRLNETLLDLGERSRFCTTVLGTVRRLEDRVSVRFSSAGHPSPVWLSAAGQARFLGRSGTLLGVVPQIDVADDEVLLHPGDSLIFYTDGVTERRGAADMFGDDNLLRVLSGAHGRSADDIAGILEAAVQRFGQGSSAARDDLAVLVVTATPAPRAQGEPVEARVTRGRASTGGSVAGGTVPGGPVPGPTIPAPAVARA